MSTSPQTILMADDDIEDLELFGEAILDIEPGSQLKKLTNGRAVIEYLSAQSDSQLPCLIILDYNMPELTGSEILTQICAQPRYNSIPKVILSTSNSPLHIEECMNSGATAYFVKPNNMKDVQALAQQMLSLCHNGSLKI